METKSSPWYEYLRRVYRSEVPLPFDVAQLELFYPAMLPTSMCQLHWGGEVTRLPRCRATDPSCDGWLDPQRRPSASTIRMWMNQRSYIVSPAALAMGAVRARRPFSQFVALQEGVRWPTPSKHWVEVARIKPDLDPEVGYGGATSL